MKKAESLSTKHKVPPAPQLLQQGAGEVSMGNCWLRQPRAVGLGIWHCPSHGADPPCPGHQHLACLHPHLTKVTAGGWGRRSPGLAGWAKMDGPLPSPWGLPRCWGQGLRKSRNSLLGVGGGALRAGNWGTVGWGEPVKAVGVQTPLPPHPHSLMEQTELGNCLWDIKYLYC